MHLGQPVIFISHSYPYLHTEYKAVMDCVIRTCGSIKATVPHLLDILTREGVEIATDEA